MFGHRRVQRMGAIVGQPAIFLDRDGVLNENRADYVRAWDEFVFLPGTFAAMRALALLGAPIVVVSNQAGVGRGLIPRWRVDEIHQRMSEEIVRQGARIERILWCPHTTADDCACRKPKPGMLLRAAEQLGIDLAASVFVGDAETDIEAGRMAGCRTVLVLTGRGQAAAAAIGRGTSHDGGPDAVADDLKAAVPVIRRLLTPATTQRARWPRPRHARPALVVDDLVSHGLPAGKG
jgi:histidinol-phosphate phosphatase family protein